jgi:hypothetical protein
LVTDGVAPDLALKKIGIQHRIHVIAIVLVAAVVIVMVVLEIVKHASPPVALFATSGTGSAPPIGSGSLNTDPTACVVRGAAGAADSAAAFPVYPTVGLTPVAEPTVDTTPTSEA